jgi:LysM repeat protein
VDLLLLMAVNGITDPGAIAAGDELTIPAPGSERWTPTPLPETLRPGQEIVYLVEPGDTLLGIAAEFNSTVDRIAQANNIEPDAILGTGQRLIIPVNIVTRTPTATGGTPTPTRTMTP